MLVPAYDFGGLDRICKKRGKTTPNPLVRSPLAASSAPKTNPQSLIVGELPARDVFYAIAATFRALNWRGGNPFRIALAAMTPNIVAIGF